MGDRREGGEPVGSPGERGKGGDVRTPRKGPTFYQKARRRRVKKFGR